MKKLFFTVLAASALTACNNDDVVSVKPMGQIAFDGAFIDNATRAAADPSTTTGSIKDFDVWGFMDNATGIVFNDEDVTKAGSEWTYANVQYWSPSKTYWFAALSPMNSANVTETIASGENAKKGLGTINFTNVDGSEDLIYAATTVTTPANINSQPDPVKFQFNHLLSKVKFTFKNGFSNDNTQLVVKEIKMEVAKTGSINLAQDDWWSTNQWTLGTENLTLEFGDVARLIQGESDECAQERLTIPADKDQVYKVTFKVDLYQGDVLAQEFTEETTVNGVALEIGKAYNFTAELNAANLGLFPITFEVVEVKDWVEDTNFQEEIVADNSTVTLVSDGEAAKTIQVKNNGILDGADHTMSVAENPTAADFVTGGKYCYINVTNDGTIKNLTIDGENSKVDNYYGIRGIHVQSGNLVVDNVDIKNVTYSLNVSRKGKATVSNSEWCGFISGFGDGSTFTNVKFVNNSAVGLNDIKPYGNVTLINCSFEKGFMIDMESLDGTITFINCTYDGKLITANNYQNTDFITWDKLDATKVSFDSSVADIKQGETVVMEKDGVVLTSLNINNGTLDGAGHTLTVATVPGDNGIIRPEGTCTIKNLTIDGNNKSTKEGKVVRGFYITKAGTYTIDNVTVDNAAYALNASGDITLNVKNSTFEGWTSYGANVNATFDHVDFIVGNFFGTDNKVYSKNDNGLFRPYGTTTLKDCNFAKDFIIDFSELKANNKTISFENCYYNGTRITEDNINTLGLADAYEASLVTFVK